MPVAILKDSTTKVLEDICLCPTDDAALDGIAPKARFTTAPVPVASGGSGSNARISSVEVNADGEITRVQWSSGGTGYAVGDVIAIRQGGVLADYTLPAGGPGQDAGAHNGVIDTDMQNVSIAGRTVAAGKTAVIFPSATWIALSEKPTTDGSWTVADDFTVALLEKSDLEKLKDEARELHSWLEAQSVDIEKYGHYYPDSARQALHDGEAQAHRGAHVILLRNAPSVAALTIAARREWIKYVQKGFKDAATVQAAYPKAVLAGVARQLAGLTPVVRIPSSPLTWADPRTDPPTLVNVADVIDFSSATGAAGLTGLNLLTTQTDLAADYSTGDWIDDILGDVPAKLFDLTATPSTLTLGTVLLRWGTPEDSGSPITGIDIQHLADPTDQEIDDVNITTDPANTISHTLTALPAGVHVFRVAAKNANGRGSWKRVKFTVPSSL